MTPSLRASSLATLAATMLSFGSPQGSFTDGRGDWTDYAWKTITVADCTPSGAELVCPPYHQKWDWKRNQWVDIGISIDPASHTLHLSQQLTDLDPSDDDHVCVTALVVDGAGQNLIAHHQNWYMKHGESVLKQYSYTSARLEEAASIHIGSKQCRKGATQDDALYAQVLAGIAR